MTTLHTMVGAALAAACLIPFAPQGAQPMKPTVVAVVDDGKAMESYPRWNGFEQQLKMLRQKSLQRIDELTREIDEVKARIEATRGSQDAKQADFEREMLMRRRDWLAKSLEDEFEVERARLMTLCYQDIAEVVAKVAQARGVQIVHRRIVLEEPGDVATMPPSRLREYTILLDRRQVWYAAPEVDLTNDVIKELQVFEPKKKVQQVEAAGSPAPAKPDGGKPDPAAADPKAGDPKGGANKGGG